MLELFFKLLISLAATFVYCSVLCFVWSHQIDVRETVRKWTRRGVQQPIEQIATREPNAIYQNGKMVGHVSGEVQELEDKIIFDELYDTAELNRNQLFEWKREKLRVISIQGKAQYEQFRERCAASCSLASHV